MSIGSPKLARRDQAIEATRRRLRRLEIETHRIKAELARLEAEYEDDVADRLTRKLRRRAPIGDQQSNQPHDAAIDLAPNSAAGATVLRFDRSAVTGIADPGPRTQSRRVSSGSLAAPSLPEIFNAPPGAIPTQAARGKQSLAGYRKAASPILLSSAVHLVVLSLCLTITIATINQQEVELFASPADLSEDVTEFSEFEVEKTKFDDNELQNIVAENQEFNINDNITRDFEPVQLGAGSQQLGDIGKLDALPGDLGTLMAGAGDAGGGGKPGGPLGEAVFFGARSKGDRFAFVVDNSSSMKGGRLEVAIDELLNAVDALSPRQSFYVIFVSDETYPMFFPQQSPDMVLATEPNKRRLAEWLPNAILASGNNRKLIEAMDMAAALRPHAVYLLWDGDMKYSDKVRIEVMTHFTRPNQWDFTIHTLGMGTLSLDSQQNLAAIAAAHGGLFRRVDVPAARR